MDIQTEKEILKLLADEKTKRQGFSRLVKEMSHSLYWQIRKMVLSHDDSDDILQNTFIKVWEHLDQFKGDSRLSTWMFRIAINETYSFLNKQREESLADFTDLEDVMVQQLHSDPYFSGDETAEKLQQAVLNLPDKQRLVFNMKYYNDMKYEEMSEILGTSVGALKASYHIAVKKIQAYLTADLI